MVNISISRSNSKMGPVPSFSFPPLVTCAPGCACAKKCYAAKLCRLRPAVREAYARNLAAWQENPAAVELQIEAAAACTRFFRFFVSGDFPDMEFVKMAARIARRQPGTEFLCFTKRYSLLNDFAYCEDIPRNLHIIFSEWPGMDMPNPHNFPVAHVVFKGEEPAEEWAVCPGSCSECGARKTGCWTLRNGEHICFAEH